MVLPGPLTATRCITSIVCQLLAASKCDICQPCFQSCLPGIDSRQWQYSTFLSAFGMGRVYFFAHSSVVVWFMFYFKIAGLPWISVSATHDKDGCKRSSGLCLSQTPGNAIEKCQRHMSLNWFNQMCLSMAQVQPARQLRNQPYIQTQ